ncbi:MAG: SusE domain-containing protein [Muribaculaceae bacterium]|nr:SusE domain-containing protein [Muribaculaceae bacterium]
MDKHIKIKTLSILLSSLFVAGVSSCAQQDIDNEYSRNNSIIELLPSTSEIILDENNPNSVALTLQWNAAHAYGNDFITTYQYQIEAEGSIASSIKEYEDDGIFVRAYTNQELQEMLVNHFGCKTSTKTSLKFTITASFVGPRVVLPDISTVTINVKTYGEKQYLADQLFIGGSAVGNNDIELFPTTPTSNTYTWTGELKAGEIYFPVIYGDENNAISPVSPSSPISEDEMDFVMVDESKTNYWIIPETANYRITVNLNTRTVKIVNAGTVIELDKLYLAGSAVGSERIEMIPCLEKEGLFAYYGTLNAGNLYMPMEFGGDTQVSFIPKNVEDHSINDGISKEFTQALTDGVLDKGYWEIPQEDNYRIVVDITEHTVTIYSPATDKTNVVVSYNNTVDGINPYTQEVTELWMWGGFNDSAHDSGLKAGFQEKFRMTQSVANPRVFVYYGSNIPRGTSTDDWSGATGVGALNFLVSNIENNVYAYGSTISAQRNNHRGYLSVNLGDVLELVPGQSDNRYAYFCVPENCNFVVVDIENLTVLFDHK